MKKSNCELIVGELADHLLVCGLDDEFCELARQKQRGLRLDDLKELQSMFHHPPEESTSYSIEKHGLGGWLSACQFSIFELIYNFGEEAIPFIRKIAWGEYDWTQGNAIELLIRFAANGIQREDLIQEIKEEFPKIRFEAKLYSIEPLLSKLESSPDIKLVFDELMAIEEFKECYTELTEDDA
ncbi:hypothetical protein [Gimesia aquarii]|uniref:Uncharacterized protein n=1 Tax=Gimesia aquarii TaxID=2527964 RepID=A0A517VSL0_9PLAN|nr:hypothetical protein [Gimesia aquarii]QDT95992.1 hypothetical protein V144x_14440 [Gimesia aquarii]